MAAKPELAITTSLKNMGGLTKLLLGALGALSVGSAYVWTTWNSYLREKDAYFNLVYAG